MIQLIRGFKDILPSETVLWQAIENSAKRLFEDFGYREIRIPIMERTELFARSIGEATDIVEKEMYTFPDRKGDLITLRPEATASVVRSYIQHKMYADNPVQKFYTIGPMFRRERPQKGRYRQFYQINVEAFGAASPLVDAQLIFMLDQLFKQLQVKDVNAHINSLGCPECRPAYRDALIQFLRSVEVALCADCRRRQDKNPLRVLDCKVPTCREAVADAPLLIDYLCDECNAHFDLLKAALEGLAVSYKVDTQLVRGLDYYTRATFEMQTGALGAQSAIAGGGRYDGLVKALGGPDTPATGFAIGLDRLAEIVGLSQQFAIPQAKLFIAALGPPCQALAFEWSCQLSRQGVHTEMDLTGRSLKSQMKKANRLGVEHVLILGERELQSNEAILRNMQTKAQQAIPLEGMLENLLNRFGLIS
jgi:histidyl-tRNA synthetase